MNKKTALTQIGTSDISAVDAFGIASANNNHSNSSMVILPQKPEKSQPLQDWIDWDLKCSGITDEYLLSLVKPLTGSKRIADEINWKHWAGSDGWQLRGANIDGTFNPESWCFKSREVLTFNNGEKAPKYIHRKGRALDAYLPKGVVNNFRRFKKRYRDLLAELMLSDNSPLDAPIGQFLLEHPEIPMIIAEGGKKCLSSWELGYATVSIPGVTQWHLKGKEQELRPLLEVLFPHLKSGEVGRVVRLVFDMDWRFGLKEKKPNLNVRRQLHKFAKELECRGYDVRICIWGLEDIPNPKPGLTMEDIKGMDDFIFHGGDFDKVVEAAMTIAQWEKQFCKQKKTLDSNCTDELGFLHLDEEGNLITPLQYAIRLGEKMRYQWRFHNEQDVWRIWNGQYWRQERKKEIADFIHHQVKLNSGSERWVTECMKSLERELRQFEWMPPSQITSVFQNGVVNINTMELKPHHPENYNTSCIGRDWWTPEEEPIADPIEALKAYCPNIYSGWDYAMAGDKNRIFKLLAVCNAVLRWRLSHLQHFVHLIGKAGTGKGTFLRVLEKLVGKKNHYSPDMDSLSNPNTIAEYIDKQLITIGDEAGKISTKSVSAILKLSGGDHLSFHKKFKDWNSSPFFGGLVFASNRTVFTKTSPALHRRTCLIDFKYPLPKKNGDIENILEAEISQLTYVALSLSKEVVDTAITSSEDNESASLKATQWELECDSNSVAAFLEDQLVFVPTSIKKQQDVYTVYRDYCQERGRTPCSDWEFGKRVLEVSTQYGFPVERKKRNTGQHFIGIDLRDKSSDRDILTISQKLEEEERLEKDRNRSSPSSLPSLSSQGKDSRPPNIVTDFVTTSSLSTLTGLEQEYLPEKSDDVLEQSDDVGDEVLEPETTIYQQSDEGDEGDDINLNIAQGDSSAPALSSGNTVMVRPPNGDEFDSPWIYVTPTENGSHWLCKKEDYADGMTPAQDNSREFKREDFIVAPQKSAPESTPAEIVLGMKVKVKDFEKCCGEGEIFNKGIVKFSPDDNGRLGVFFPALSGDSQYKRIHPDDLIAFDW